MMEIPHTEKKCTACKKTKSLDQFRAPVNSTLLNKQCITCTGYSQNHRDKNDKTLLTCPKCNETVMAHRMGIHKELFSCQFFGVERPDRPNFDDWLRLNANTLTHPVYKSLIKNLK